MSDAARHDQSIMSWLVPLTNGQTLAVDAIPGEVITIVGANGAGKSALATWMASKVPHEKLRRVLAQRRIWLENSGPSITASSRESLASSMQYWDSSSDSRFRDHADGQRADITLFDLLGKIAAENHRIAELSQTERRTPDEIEEIIGVRLFDALNSVLERAGLLIQVGTTDRQAFTAVHRDLGNEYPIAQMSDGERSALLLAAEVLVVPENSVVLLDEPERHLHRSISAGLIDSLIEFRADCSFVVLTHDLDLAVGLGARPGRVFSALGLQWSSDTPTAWKLHEVTRSAPLTDAARRGILGGRKRILFIEGTNSSLDHTIYGSLFPGWTLVASGSCETVIRSVEGVRSTQDHHWVEAAGIVDGDGRNDVERQALIAKGVHPLRVSEVESLYYLTPVLEEVAARLTAVDGEDAGERVRAAKTAGLEALSENGNLGRIAKKLAIERVSRSLATTVPPTITASEISFSIPSPYGEILSNLEALRASDDYENLVRIASVRDSGFRGKVVKAIGIDRIERYQKAAAVAIAECPTLRELLRSEVADGSI